MKFSKIGMLMVALAVISTTGVAAQETKFYVEGRGGFAVPTFNITDAADPGPAFGVGFGANVAPSIWVIADADFGFHPNATTGGPDINVYHFMGKFGYDVLGSSESPWSVILTAGGGALHFDIDGIASFTYPAINAGAKIGYAATENVTLFLNPQGDIAFSDEAEVGTTNSCVWPFSAGVAIRF
ncbi:MAG: hypothetical protein QNJ97_28305 [Myxococcota bacterium]|nr:hypothetical protein [Myxococcota bacterium]